MSIKSTLAWVWQRLGGSDKARRRNAFILFLLVFLTIAGLIAYGFHCDGINLNFTKAFK